MTKATMFAKKKLQSNFKLEGAILSLSLLCIFYTLPFDPSK